MSNKTLNTEKIENEKSGYTVSTTQSYKNSTTPFDILENATKQLLIEHQTTNVSNTNQLSSNSSILFSDINENNTNLTPTEVFSELSSNI